MAENNNSCCKPVTRRSLIAAAGSAAGMLALGAGVSACRSAPLIRPPGAARGASFAALCIRCDRCRSVCPQSVIAVARLSDGLINLRTPVMDFKRGYCDWCRKCIDVCPTQALASFSGKSCVIGVAELTRSCIALRTSGCRKCRDACPEKAITLNAKGVPIIHADKCNGCGKCVLVCPANVLQSYQGGSERGIAVRPPKESGK